MDIGFLHIATAISGELTTLARRAEEIGYDSLWIPEHPVIPIERKTPYLLGGELPEHYGRWTDPFIALTMAAAVTMPRFTSARNALAMMMPSVKLWKESPMTIIQPVRPPSCPWEWPCPAAASSSVPSPR